MPWSLAFYGVEQPSKLRVVMLNSILVSCGLWGYGWWADFVPSSEWSELGFNISIASTAVFIFIYYWALASGRADFKPGISMAAKILVILFLPGMVFLLFWIAITHGFADIATQTLGKERTLTVELSKNHHDFKRNCDYQLEGYVIEKAMPNHVCITESEYGSLPEVGTYTLKTKETFLGFHIVNLNVVHDR